MTKTKCKNLEEKCINKNFELRRGFENTFYCILSLACPDRVKNCKYYDKEHTVNIPFGSSSIEYHLCKAK